MTTTNGRAVELRPSVPMPSRTGQATAVEQSRAVAEVEAAVFVARRWPRDVAAAIAEMEEACKQPELAARAFFDYPRGGETVTGESIHLARELARCWGNIQHGISELRRDDEYGQSEMLAFAWDVQTNARSSNTFIVPHARDTKKGRKDLTELRDIYENNANNGARRLREAIFSVLPTWYKERAKAICWKTQEDGGGTPLAQRIADAIKNFGAIGVSQARLEAKISRPAAEWTAHDVARLGVSYTSLRQGTVTAAEEFPEAATRVTADEITGTKPSVPAAPDEPAGGPADPPAARATKAQTAELENLLAKFPWQDGDKAVFLKWRCGGDYRATKHQAAHLIAYLKGELDSAGDDPAEALSAIWAQYRAMHEQAAAGEPDGGTGDQ